MPEWQRWKNIMKAYPFEEKRLAKWEPPYIVQPKYDGVRCRAVPVGNPIHKSYILLSSEENPIFSVPHINVALKVLQPDKELDGELYCHGMSFEGITSITSRTKNRHPDYEKINFHVFDYVDEEVEQAYRTHTLKNMEMREPLIKAPFWLANSLEDIMDIFDKLISLGYEGIIVRHYLAPYERKRSTYLMKFKPKQEDSYVITDYQEEISQEGTPKGRLGALTCLSGDGHTFNVGTGFNDVLRTDLWKSKESLPGKVCRVQYQHITSGKKVPRFPVFVEVV